MSDEHKLLRLLGHVCPARSYPCTVVPVVSFEGAPYAVYRSPKGFLLEPVRGGYRRLDTGSAPAWIDPNTHRLIGVTNDVLVPYDVNHESQIIQSVLNGTLLDDAEPFLRSSLAALLPSGAVRSREQLGALQSLARVDPEFADELASQGAPFSTLPPPATATPIYIRLDGLHQVPLAPTHRTTDLAPDMEQALDVITSPDIDGDAVAVCLSQDGEAISKLQQIAASSTSSLCLLVDGIGTGKSTLMRAFCQQADEATFWAYLSLKIVRGHLRYDTGALTPSIASILPDMLLSEMFYRHQHDISTVTGWLAGKPQIRNRLIRSAAAHGSPKNQDVTMPRWALGAAAKDRTLILAIARSPAAMVAACVTYLASQHGGCVLVIDDSDVLPPSLFHDLLDITHGAIQLTEELGALGEANRGHLDIFVPVRPSTATLAQRLSGQQSVLMVKVASLRRPVPEHRATHHLLSTVSQLITRRISAVRFESNKIPLAVQEAFRKILDSPESQLLFESLSGSNIRRALWVLHTFSRLLLSAPGRGKGPMPLSRAVEIGLVQEGLLSRSLPNLLTDPSSGAEPHTAFLQGLRLARITSSPRASAFPSSWIVRAPTFEPSPISSGYAVAAGRVSNTLESFGYRPLAIARLLEEHRQDRESHFIRTLWGERGGPSLYGSQQLRVLLESYLPSGRYVVAALQSWFETRGQIQSQCELSGMLEEWLRALLRADMLQTEQFLMSNGRPAYRRLFGPGLETSKLFRQLPGRRGEDLSPRERRILAIIQDYALKSTQAEWKLGLAV